MKKLYIVATLFMTILTLSGCTDTSVIDNPVLDEVTEQDIINLEEQATQIDGLYIGLLDNNIFTNSTNVEIQSNVVTIKSGGEYTLLGTLNNGQIVVDTSDDVVLNLNDVTIHNANGAAILIEDADEGVTINLVEGTTNTLSDGTSHSDTEITGVLHSKDNLTIEGPGTLVTIANYLDGIVSKDSLTINNGIFDITSVGDAIYGKDDLTINNGDFTIFTGEGSAAAPVIVEEGGIIGGPGGGRPPMDPTGADPTETEEDQGSFKALKSKGLITINGGTFNIDSYDDSIHSDTEITINNGLFTIESGDDAIHANNLLTIVGGTIHILYSCEGLESFSIVIEDGDIDIYAYDDGLNATNGTNTSVGGPGDHPDYSDYDIDTTPSIIINGGSVTVVSDGDGIDANGVVIINDGIVYVNGKGTSTGIIESPIDFDITGIVNGGIVIATGTSTMAYSFDSEDSLQNSFNVTFNTFYSVGTEIQILDEDSNIIGTMVAQNSFETLIFSSSELLSGETYTLIIGSDQYSLPL